MGFLPFTTSRADVFRFSTLNTKLPVSSTDRLEMVRLWTSPLALIRKWLVGFSWIPFLIQVPGTLAWDSSTSKDAVSLSVVLMSVSPRLMLIFRAVGQQSTKDRHLSGMVSLSFTQWVWNQFNWLILATDPQTKPRFETAKFFHLLCEYTNIPSGKNECLFWRPDDNNLSFEGQCVNLDAVRVDQTSEDVPTAAQSPNFPLPTCTSVERAAFNSATRLQTAAWAAEAGGNPKISAS